MSWGNIIIQLGISSLVLYVVYKIAVLLITRWAENDQKRIKVVGDGFQAITNSHEKMVEALNESHREIVNLVNYHQQAELQILKNHEAALVGLDIKVATALDLTPVRGIPRADVVAGTIETQDDDTPTPVERPTERPARAPSHPGSAWGPLRPAKR